MAKKPEVTTSCGCKKVRRYTYTKRCQQHEKLSQAIDSLEFLENEYFEEVPFFSKKELKDAVALGRKGLAELGKVCRDVGTSLPINELAIMFEHWAGLHEEAADAARLFNKTLSKHITQLLRQLEKQRGQEDE